MAAGFFAVFTCSPDERSYDSGAYYAAVEQRRALEEALAQVALLWRLERAGAVRVARSAAELDGDGLCAVLHLRALSRSGPA